MTLRLEWKLSNLPLADIGYAIANTTTAVANEQVADLAEYFPLKGNWELQGHIDEGWLIVRIVERHSSGIPSEGKLTNDELEFIKSKVLPFRPRSHSDLYTLFGTDWFGFSKFTYVGPYNESHACWPDLNQNLIDWLNHLVLPEVLRRNEARVLRAIPKPPQFNLEIIRGACWVLECDESMKQGTGFYLSGTGLVSCSHVIGPKTAAFHPDNPSKKYPVTVISKNDTIDLAILNIEHEQKNGLSAGSADNLKVMNHVAVAGFPNYRHGDTGVIIPGLVVGFRMVSGIRRILTNASIIAGNSGGPVLSANNLVIGIAVTGADMMEKAQETENHGIVPIEALNYLK